MPEKPENYGDIWRNDGTPELYDTFRDRQPDIHMEFLKWLGERDGMYDSVLEVGCGNGAYGREVFSGLRYFGVDISHRGIEFAKEHNKDEKHGFKSGDFMSLLLPRFDIVFNHSVIDHMYDVDLFILRCMDHANKWVYITAYNGYWPSLDSHVYQLEEPHRSCFVNRLSVPRLHDLLNGLDYSIDTFQDRGMPVTRIIVKFDDDNI